MTFVEAIQTCVRKYADFEGVAKRPEFWWWILFAAIVSGILGTFAVIPVSQTGTVGGILTGIWTLATLLPTLGVTVRRLRDAGYVWQNILWILVPVAGVIVLAIYLAKPSSPTAPAPAAG
ncbi:MAG: DUF805 domain-containing protein [Pseudolysinimonas sp.]|uniref:DUF805 domain-containing protein n=1 Tax=Pseudolysinimonas sp. TaxID=2680009 RepID=UPI003265D728